MNELTHFRVIITNDVPTMPRLPFKIINPAKMIGVSNLKDGIEKSTIANFSNNVKYPLDNMSSDYTITIGKG